MQSICWVDRQHIFVVVQLVAGINLTGFNILLNVNKFLDNSLHQTLVLAMHLCERMFLFIIIFIDTIFTYLSIGGKGCTAYDIVVHPNFLTRIQNSEVMLGFFITICIEGLEAKYNITLNRKWTILKNKKFIGSLPEQNIRTQSKPLIQDLSGSVSYSIDLTDLWCIDW